MAGAGKLLKWRWMLVAGIYLMVVLATSCLSVLSSVLVLGIHHQRGKPQSVPKWLRFLVFHLIARIVCIGTYTQHHTSTTRGHGHRSMSRSTSSRERKLPRSPRRGRVATEENEIYRMDYRTKFSDAAASAADSLLESSIGGANSGHPHGEEGASHANCLQCTVQSNETEVVRQLIDVIQNKHSQEVKDEEVFREWHDVAYVLDRLLFYVFLFITVVSAICILEMRPPDIHF